MRYLWDENVGRRGLRSAELGWWPLTVPDRWLDEEGERSRLWLHEKGKDMWTVEWRETNCGDNETIPMSVHTHKDSLIISNEVFVGEV